MSVLNIYEKLQKVRVELQGKSLKKSGENKFAKYKYYELGDFLPIINKLFLEHKLFSQITFTSEVAILKVIDIENPENCIEFYSPMADADLKGCHAIQNLGAVQTYQRRYLYMTALEIVEHDALDATTGQEKPRAEQAPQKPAVKPGTTITKAEQDKMVAIAKGNVKAAKAALEEFGYTNSKDVTKTDYENVCKEIEKKLKEAG